jgi:predicted regulator of Ras-like GTPase activity (Roadblock/LC7/MglB family)
VAAYLTGVAEEAGRTTRLLDLGAWHSVLVEGQMANMLLARPTEQTVLLLTRDRTVPQGRLGVLADRACRSAHTWLEEQHL